MSTERAITGSLLLVLAVTTVGSAATAMLYGPLVIMPAAVIINALPFLTALKRKARALAIAMGCLGITVPFALELAGVTSAYQTTAGGILIIEQAIALERSSMLLISMTAALFGFAGAAVAFGCFRDVLAAKETELRLRDWHLEQVFAPATANDEPR